MTVLGRPRAASLRKRFAVITLTALALLAPAGEAAALTGAGTPAASLAAPVPAEATGPAPEATAPATTTEPGATATPEPAGAPATTATTTAATSYAAGSATTASATTLPDPATCPSITPQAFGATASESTVACRRLEVPAPGPYIVGATDAQTAARPYEVYRSDGTPVCSTASPTCSFDAAGTYLAVLPGYSSTPTNKVVFVDLASTAGCVTAGDNGLVGPAIRGELRDDWQYDCLTLPTPAGARLAAAAPTGYAYHLPRLRLVDATGATRCENAALTAATCVTSGPAPYRLVVSDPAGRYTFGLYRPDTVPAQCPALGKDAYTTDVGAQVVTDADHHLRCVRVPAEAAARNELFQLAAADTYENSELAVFGPGGAAATCPTWQAFTAGGLLTCRLEAGREYLAVVRAAPAKGTYKITRRDLDGGASADCPEAPSLRIGKPAAAGTLTSVTAAACVHVSAAATDRLRAAVRSGLSEEFRLVVNPNLANPACRPDLPCEFAGATSYRIVAVKRGGNGTTAKPYRLDVWRIWSAAGPPAECPYQAVRADGFGPLTGTLTSSDVATCVLVPVKPGDTYAITTSNPDGILPGLILANDNGTAGCRNGGWTSASWTCSVDSSRSGPRAILITETTVLPYDLPFRVDGNCSTRPCGLKPAVQRIEPIRATTGAPRTVKLTGSGLLPGTTAALTRTGHPSIPFTGVTLADDWTSLTGTVDLTRAEWGNWTVTVTAPDGTTATGPYPFAVDPLPPPAGSAFFPLPPTRLMDTRDGTGVRPGALKGGESLRLEITGRAGVPIDATAVVLNVTVTEPTGPGHLIVQPFGTARPNVSNLNFVKGQTVPNAVTVPLNGGDVSFWTNAPATHVIADIAGYYMEGEEGSAFNAAGPARLMDTRDGTGVRAGVLPQGRELTLQVAGRGGVPADATAVVLNVTVTEPTGPGHLIVYPYGTTRPNVSNLNFVTGQTVPNAVTVPLKDGKITFWTNTPATHVITDVNGYFAATGSRFEPVTPSRLMDTRDGTGVRAGVLPQGRELTLQVAGRGGVPADATAVVLNVTVTEPTGPGHLIVYPYGTTRPNVSNLNFVTGQTVPNAVTVPLKDGKITFWTNTPATHVITDVSGYYRA